MALRTSAPDLGQLPSKQRRLVHLAALPLQVRSVSRLLVGLAGAGGGGTGGTRTEEQMWEPLRT